MLQSHPSLPANDLLAHRLLHPAYSIHATNVPSAESYEHFDRNCYFQLGRQLALFQSVLQTPPTPARIGIRQSECSAFERGASGIAQVPFSLISSSTPQHNPSSYAVESEKVAETTGEMQFSLIPKSLTYAAHSAALVVDQLAEQMLQFSRQRPPNPLLESGNSSFGLETTRKLSELLHYSQDHEPEGEHKRNPESPERPDQADSLGCIDLSLTGRRVNQTCSAGFTDAPRQVSQSYLSDAKRIFSDLLLRNHQGPGPDKQFHAVSSKVPAEAYHPPVTFLPHLALFEAVQLGATTPASSSITKSEVCIGESVRTHTFNNSGHSGLVKPVKTRKSGFQAGVTVGYTYDAFFISDGRSRRRGKIKTKRSVRRSCDESGLLCMSSSSGHSNCSTSSSFQDAASEIVTPKTSPCSPNHSTPPNHLLFAAASCPPVEQCTQRYSCPDCGKSYATSSNLSRHKQTHRSLDSQAARKCPHCGKAYVSMPALSMHILTHDLKHRCDLCGKAFSRPWLLQGHRRAHTGEKPYGCAHCGRAFADRSNLRAHMQTHSSMKQYECKRCHKNFALKSYLNKHLESACTDRFVTGETKRSISVSADTIHVISGLPWSVSKLIDEDT